MLTPSRKITVLSIMMSMRVSHAMVRVRQLSVWAQKGATPARKTTLHHGLWFNMVGVLTLPAVTKLLAQPRQKVVDVSVVSLCARAHVLFEWTCAWRSIVISLRACSQSFFTVCQKVVLLRTV